MARGRHRRSAPLGVRLLPMLQSVGVIVVGVAMVGAVLVVLPGGLASVEVRSDFGTRLSGTTTPTSAGPGSASGPATAPTPVGGSGSSGVVTADPGEGTSSAPLVPPLTSEVPGGEPPASRSQDPTGPGPVAPTAPAAPTAAASTPSPLGPPIDPGAGHRPDWLPTPRGLEKSPSPSPTDDAQG